MTPQQWRRKMFWDRGVGVCVEIFFDLFFSCEEAALVASSHYIQGQALTYCTLLLSMDVPAAMVRHVKG